MRASTVSQIGLTSQPSLSTPVARRSVQRYNPLPIQEYLRATGYWRTADTAYVPFPSSSASADISSPAIEPAMLTVSGPFAV